MFSLATKHIQNSIKLHKQSACNLIAINYCSKPKSEVVLDDSYAEDSGFRKLELYPKPTIEVQRRQPKKHDVPPPRYKRMSVKQKWSDVWPGPRTFHPATVPLPMRQGFLRKKDNKRPPPYKFGNAELMKIPNFLHLTPPAIRQQCTAIKKYCTKWPIGLETDEQCDEHFPIEFISTDYCHGLPSIRNRLSRIISLRFKVSSLPLDEHARDKFLRLVANRYDPNTDIVTITVDRCPIRKQNYDYAQYLLTALFHESFITEPWESLKVEADMEYYDWNKNVSKEHVESILKWGKSKDESIKSTDKFAKSVEKIFHEGENEENLQEYKTETLKMLGLKN